MKKIVLFLSLAMIYCSTVAFNGCPDDLVVYIDPGESGAIVTYPTPSIPDVEPIEGYISLGIYDGKAFYLSERMDAAVAFADAVSKGGFVATVRSEAENGFIRTLVSNSVVGENPVLIGLNDVDTEGSFVWHSGAAEAYRNWNSDEPNGGTGENYVEMQPSGGWNDVPGINMHYVLELPAPEIIQTAGLPSGALFPVGTTTNVFSNGCSFTVTVAYNDVPVICPGNIVTNNDPDVCGAIVEYESPAGDNGSTGEIEPIAGFTSLGINDGKAFYLSDVPLAAVDMFAHAEANGGYVATVRNEAENEFLVNSIIAATGDLYLAVFIGLNDAADEGVWVWHSGEPVAYTNWHDWEPNGGTGENYTELYDEKWNDLPGTYTRRYVLEKTVSGGGATQTAGLPSGSLFPVGVTLNEFSNGCSFTVTVVDNEPPSITCPDDIVTFTDPGACGAIVEYEVPVSDNCSSVEIEPIEGFTALGINNGKAFYLSNRGMNFTEAYADAALKGGYLATIRNAAENQFLTERMASATGIDNLIVLIGLNDVATEGTFVWHSGEPITFTNWYSGEPNDYGDGEDYTELWFDGGWNDVSEGVVHQYVLEVDISGVEITQTAGLPSGSLFPVGETTTNTFVVTDAAGNTNTCSFDITIEKRPTLITYTGDTEGVYSDIIIHSATLMDVSDPDNPVPVEGKWIIFNFGDESLAEWTDASGVATRESSATPEECEDLTISALFEGDCSYLGDEDSKDFILLPENADGEYTGTAIAATKSSFSDEFTVMLRGIIIEDDDDSTGDISKATARFVVDGVPVCDFMPVMLLTEENQSVGIIEFEWAGSLRDNPSLYDVQIEINSCFYDGMSVSYPLTVYRAAGDFITGGGHMIMSEAAGLYPPSMDSKLNFGFNVKYNKKGTNLQGKMNIIYRMFEGEELVKVYQIKSNATTSLGTNIISKDERLAEFVSKANLTDVTNPEYPVELGGNLTLHVTMTDKGEPGDEDQIAFSLYDGEPNALWFSSNWTGVKTLEQVINGGNLVVHSGAALEGGDVVEVPKGKKSATIGGNSFDAYPNPFSDRLFFEFTREESSKALLEIFDAAGRKLTVLFNQPAEAGQNYRLEYTPVQPVAGMLFYRMTFDNEVINGKVVCSK